MKKNHWPQMDLHTELRLQEIAFDAEAKRREEEDLLLLGTSTLQLPPGLLATLQLQEETYTPPASWQPWNLALEDEDPKPN